MATSTTTNSNEEELLIQCIKCIWTDFKQFELNQLGIGRDFIVFITKENKPHCIRMSLGDYGNNILEFESIKLQLLQKHLSKYHKWIIPIYKDIKTIYCPSAFKPKLKSVIYESIGNQTVWDLHLDLIPFMKHQFDNIGKYFAAIHTFNLNNIKIQKLNIKIVSPKEMLLTLINEANIRSIDIKKSNKLTTNLYNKCIRFIKWCEINIINNKNEDIFGFSEFLIDNINDNIWNKYCLVHGDLHFAHFIIDDNDNNNIKGVIDWSDIRITDPASEFRYIWAIFGDWIKSSNYYKHRLRMETIINININYNNNNNDLSKWIQFKERARVYGIICSFLSIFWSIRQGSTSNCWIEKTKIVLSANITLIYEYIQLQALQDESV